MKFKNLYPGTALQFIIWFILLAIIKGEIINAVVGESIILDCGADNFISNISSNFAEWRKHDVLYEKITYRKKPADSWTSPVLHLDKVLLADSGIYNCLLKQNGSFIGNKTFSVHVKAHKARKPQITSTSLNRNITVFNHQRVSLKCHAQSSDVPYMQWYYSKDRIASAKSAKLILDHTGIAFTSKLVLEKKTLREGFYTCFVFDQYGSHSKSVYVRVKPVPPKTKMELAKTYEQKYIKDDSVPLGVVIGIPVSVFIIVLAAALTLYERYSWRNPGRRISRGGSEGTAMLKPNEDNVKSEEEKRKKDNNNLNGQIQRSSSLDDISGEHHVHVEEGDDVVKETSTPSDLNKSLSSFNPDIDLEWEGVELGPMISVQTVQPEVKPSIAQPEDDSLLFTQEDLWEMFDTSKHRTRPVLISKDEQKSNSCTETIV